MRLAKCIGSTLYADYCPLASPLDNTTCMATALDNTTRHEYFKLQNGKQNTNCNQLLKSVKAAVMHTRARLGSTARPCYISHFIYYRKNFL